MRDLEARHIILCFLLFNPFVVFPQDGAFRPSRAEAEAAWTGGNFETAFQHYNGLLLLYSRDPLYKFYSGACLVNMERDLPRAVTLLASAINSSVNVKTVPDEVWFYYGRALQMSGSYSQAREAYVKFEKVAGKKRAQALAVGKYLDQCDNGQGKMSEVLQAETTEQRIQDSKSVTGIDTAAHTAGTEGGTKQGVMKTEQEATIVLHDENVKIPANIPEEYDARLTRAVNMQYAADSLNRLAQNIRRQMENAVPKEPLLLRAEKLEKEAAAMQAEADRIFLTLEPDDKVREEAKVDVRDEVKVNEEVRDEREAVFFVFEVRSSPFYGTNVQIPIGSGAPQGLVYRIQLAAFKNPLPPGYFKGLYPLYGKVNPANGVTYYYTGMFRSLERAREALPQARAAGFSDAFVVALMDDTQVSMERAALLENEWGTKPLYFTESAPANTTVLPPADSIPVGTLSFRAEVMRSKKPVSPEVAQKITLLSGGRGLDIIKNNQGETLYLIGNFITFESAGEYVSLLIRNGYSTARVAAYVGNQEIPVESARELLKKLQND